MITLQNKSDKILNIGNQFFVQKGYNTNLQFVSDIDNFILNPEYDNRYFIANPNYNNQALINGSLNPDYSPELEILNSNYDPEKYLYSNVVQPSGVVTAESGTLTLTATRTIDGFQDILQIEVILLEPTFVYERINKSVSIDFINTSFLFHYNHRHGITCTNDNVFPQVLQQGLFMLQILENNLWRDLHSLNEFTYANIRDSSYRLKYKYNKFEIYSNTYTIKSYIYEPGIFIKNIRHTDLKLLAKDNYITAEKYYNFDVVFDTKENGYILNIESYFAPQGIDSIDNVLKFDLPKSSLTEYVCGINAKKNAFVNGQLVITNEDITLPLSLFIEIISIGE